jgi:hypothetical protein
MLNRRLQSIVPPVRHDLQDQRRKRHDQAGNRDKRMVHAIPQ